MFHVDEDSPIQRFNDVSTQGEDLKLIQKHLTTRNWKILSSAFPSYNIFQIIFLRQKIYWSLLIKPQHLYFFLAFNLFYEIIFYKTQLLIVCELHLVTFYLFKRWVHYYTFAYLLLS